MKNFLKSAQAGRLAAVAALTGGLMSLVGVGVASAGTASAASPNSVFRCGFRPDFTCAMTVGNVHIRTQPTSQSASVTVYPKDNAFELACWTNGESVNGDSVWYYGNTDMDYPNNATGWISGYWLATGKDPAGGIRHC